MKLKILDGQSSPFPAQMQDRLLALDGLRAISILLVILSHAGLGYIVPGGLGVTIFFFISGFIITRLMVSEWDRVGYVSIRKFYIRRFFRLMPALLIFILCALTVMQMASVNWRWVELGSVFFYFANYFGIFVGFSENALPSPLSITWSLAVEEHFYMIFPVMFAALIAVPKRFLSLVVFLLVLFLGWRIYLVYGLGLANLPDSRIYKATDTRADSILYGTALALLLVRKEFVFDLLKQKSVFVFGVLLMLISLFLRDENFRESYRYSLQGVALFLMFVNLVLVDGLISRILSSYPLVYIGKISYSLYLYHWLVYCLMALWMPSWSLPVKIIVMMTSSLLLADVSYRLIEKRFLVIGHRYVNDLA
ncbi:acyltransferase [Undibacterium jejuense]|uniref:Acyltransferase n=1 Tax=Undibacterium jejuense TaxID=1344949 RepID=A0A923HFY8_9BURK|nr:acyltransferase [Undibacterium jejuense]MBC3862315.1 acyltransferase [Undibacterium jejuense]